MYAVITSVSWLSNFQTGKRDLAAVTITDSTDVVSVDKLERTLVFIQTLENKDTVVVKTANKHSHVIFK